MKTILLATTFLFTVAGRALAADAVVYEQAPELVPAGFTWSGAYAGVHIGYAWGNADFTDVNGWNGLAGERFGFNPDGTFGGIQAGYNWQFGSAVVGAEAELGYLDIDGRGLQEDGTFNDTHGFVDGGLYAGLSARLGYALDRTLLYAKAGAVYSNGKYSAVDESSTPPGTGTFSGSGSIGWGYQIGAGVEHAVTDNWTLKLEYAYFDFGKETFGDPVRYSGDLSAHTLKIGVNYKF